MSAPLVLVADDDPDTRDLYRLVFELSGYRVVEADGVAAAVDAAREYRPDVAVVDWMLGDGDGLTLCRELHRCGATRRIPVVAATGVSLEPDVISAARALGCHAFLTKPVALDALVHAVATSLEIALARRLRAAAVRLRRYSVHARKDASRTLAQSNLTAADILAASLSRVDMSVALIVADDRGHVAANERAAELTGYDADALASMSVAELTRHPETPETDELWNAGTDPGTQEGVYLVKRRDGVAVPTRYVAVANIAPGLHLHALSARKVPVPL
jgi:PAS domain S-box-containing protein